eukprot:12314456-Alexandrium_andersonii.AAC.1
METVSLPRPGQGVLPGTPLSYRMKSARGMDAHMYLSAVGVRVACGVVCPTPRAQERLEEGVTSRRSHWITASSPRTRTRRAW